jgi:hypothetical protein
MVTRVSAPTKLAAFALALAAALGLGAAIGSAAGPIDVDGGDEHEVEHTPTSIPETESHWGGHTGDH